MQQLKKLIKVNEKLFGKKFLQVKKHLIKQVNGFQKKHLDVINEYLIAIKGPLTTPVGGGIRSLNVALRQELDLICMLTSCSLV